MNNNLYNQLIDKVIEQITHDIEAGDTTAVDELLRHCPIKALIGYLPDDMTGGQNVQD